MSKVNALYHIVICTKYRTDTITPLYERDLYRFIWKTIEENKCKLVRIGGIENHIHMLVDLHPTVALSDLMRDIKRVSSAWMKTCGKFPDFTGWGKEYAAFSISHSAKGQVISYINNQKEHHKAGSVEDEIKMMLYDNGMLYDGNFF